MSGIRKSDSDQVSFVDKLEYARGTVLMLAEDDDEATAIAQTLSVQLGIEASDPEDIDKWCDDYDSSTRKIASRYHSDMMPYYSESRVKR